MVWGAKRHPKGGHFGSQNAVKIFEKSRCKFKTEKIASWNLLGSIWARFPSRLGVKNLDFSLVFKGFRENPRFWWTWVSKNDLGSKLEQNRAWNRAAMESQIDQKEASKLRSIFNRFLEGLGPRASHGTPLGEANTWGSGAPITSYHRAQKPRTDNL